MDLYDAIYENYKKYGSFRGKQYNYYIHPDKNDAEKYILSVSKGLYGFNKTKSYKKPMLFPQAVFFTEKLEVEGYKLL